MKKRECINECPLPICNLPDVLSPAQMRMAMIHLNISYKMMESDLNMVTSAISHGMHDAKKCPAHHKKISDYLKDKLLF
jgi:hypothetical protein